jgi:nucleoside-diphosphate-sugar epimerase
LTQSGQKDICSGVQHLVVFDKSNKSLNWGGGPLHWPYKRALVTGGAGFIGSHLVEALVDTGCGVSVIDNLSTGRRENLAGVADRIDFFPGDIRDGRRLMDAGRGCDVVFHLAAVVSVVQTVADPVETAMVNDLGTLQVLEAARQFGAQRLVLSSSSAVYGDDAAVPNCEGMTPRPVSPYAAQKLAGEEYARLYHRLYGLDTVCLRYFNVFGPKQDPSSPYSGVISIFMTRAIAGRPPVIYGDGRQYRDFVFVADVVQANLAAAAEKQAAGGVFNIGTGEKTSVNELWERIGRLAGIRLDPERAPARGGEIIESVADIQRAADQFGFSPSFTFNRGLEKTYRWYRTQPESDGGPKKSESK